jgi:penicillin amidase
VITLTQEQRTIARAALDSDGEIAGIAASHGLNVDELVALVSAYLREKANLGPSTQPTQVSANVTITRDERGVPHIAADTAADLFFGVGYAHAQDRLWHLDFHRRYAHGTLAEILGPSRLNDDILARTLDITGIAEATYAMLHPESREAYDAFTAGVNAWMAAAPNGLPAEFEWLGYEPAPWTPIDSIAILRRWWWYLTGRLHVLWVPEVIRTQLGDDLAAHYYTPDAPIGTIVPPGFYDPEPRWPALPGSDLDRRAGGDFSGHGSNNWTIAPSHSATGGALLASDPHVFFTLPMDWYEYRLKGAGYDVYGLAYPGQPGLFFGRNRQVAWGITNNICLQRDLYEETINPDDPNQYRSGDGWVNVEQRISTIAVKGMGTVEHITRYAHGRPVVDHLVPEAAMPAALRGTTGRSLSLAWTGLQPSDEIKAALDLNRSTTIHEARAAYEPWKTPTFNIMLADAHGQIGYQTIGAIPLRATPKLGYRDANNPDDRWQGAIPFDGLPRMTDPERGWIASANNQTAPDDFPYPLAGAWTPEDRYPRIVDLMEARAPHSLDSMHTMQVDVHTARGLAAARGITAAITTPATDAERAAIAALNAWDGELTTDTIAGTVYNVFFERWHKRVMRERFPEERFPFAIDSGNGLSGSLLHANTGEWFTDDHARLQAIRETFTESVAWIVDTLGSDPAGWAWGNLHTLGGIHPAAQTPLQRHFFNLPYLPHQGGTSTVRNAGYGLGAPFITKSGGNYRFVADLGNGAAQAIVWPGNSGEPGSAHYADQVQTFLEDGIYDIPFGNDLPEGETITLIPS